MIPYTPYLTTLERIRAARRHEVSEDEDDALILQFIEGASAGIGRATGRVFVPYMATYLYDALGAHLGGFAGYPDTLYLDDDDLLTVTTLTNGDATAITGSQYVLRPANEYPKHEIVLKSSAGVSFTYSTDWEQAISIAGWWGHVPHYATAWKSVTQLNGGVNASVTALTVDTTTGIEVGGYLKIDSEIMRVSAKTSATAYTVVRGEQGTTAAVHADDSAVTVYQFIPDLQHAATELVSYLYKNKDNLGGRVSVYEGGILQVSDIDPTVKETIRRYTRITYGVV
jgi:hypothetical protein